MVFVANEVKDEALSQATGGLSDYVDVTRMAFDGLKSLARSVDDIAGNLSRGSDKLTDVVLDRDDDFMQVTGKFQGTEVGMQGTFSLDDGVLTIEGADFFGEVGVGNIRRLVHEFGSTAGVSKVHIIPNPRQSGANPGKTPEPFSINIEQ